ncbi:MAG TPA: hypothetical protein VGP77_09590 [Vicinamibacterales bacterium]|nr:hypothetical protein [Vicinamibacterales bacterium]
MTTSIQHSASIGSTGWHWLTALSLLLASLLLAACGGSDPSGVAPVTAEALPPCGIEGSGARVLGCTGGPQLPPPPALATSTPIVGVFGGTLSDDQRYDLLYVVMRDGTKVGYFGTDWSNSFKFVDFWISGDSAGSWVSADGTRSGTFNGFYRGEPAFVAASFDMAIPSLSGVITAGQFTTKTVAFSGGAIPGSSYRFDTPAKVAAVEGTWELVDQVGNAVAINVASDGALKGSYRGCSFTGSAKPSDGGENALMLSFDFDQPVANCQPDLENTQGYRGFAIALPMTSGGTRLLMFVGSNEGFDWIVFAAVGQR